MGERYDTCHENVKTRCCAHQHLSPKTGWTAGSRPGLVQVPSWRDGKRRLRGGCDRRGPHESMLGMFPSVCSRSSVTTLAFMDGQKLLYDSCPKPIRRIL